MNYIGGYLMSDLTSSHLSVFVWVLMRQWPVLSDEHSCLVLTAALSKATLYLCMYVCESVRVCTCTSLCVCVRHPRSAPLKQKASPQRSLRQLHPTTWPQTTRLPITLCHISTFLFSCVHTCWISHLCTLSLCLYGLHPSTLQLNFFSGLQQFEQIHLSKAGWSPVNS